MRFQLFDLQKPFFLNNWLLNVNWILDWNLDWYLDSDRYFDYFFSFDWRLLNINWSIDIYWLLYNSWHFYCNCLYHFSWNLFNNFNRHFLLNFYVFRNLNDFFNYSLRTRNCFYNFYYNLNRLFNDNFFNNFFWCSLHKSLYLIFPFFKQFLCHIQINSKTIVLSFLLSNNSIMIIAYFRSIFEILKLKVKPYSLFFGFFQLILQFFYFFEQFFQAVLILIIFLNLNLYLLVTL